MRMASAGVRKRRKTDAKKEVQYIAGLDGLRAIAVLMVIAYHLKLPFAKGGLLGVTVFFVISGFLITRILISEMESTGAVDLRKFWVRRIRRLMPAVLVMVTALIFITALVNRVLFTKACQDLLSAVFCYNNWHQIFNQVSYFENAGAPSPLSHYWSLAVEAQFYLIYPLLLAMLARLKNSRKLSACITLALALISMALMWMLFDPAKDPSRVYYGTDTRAFSLLFGAFSAYVAGGRKVRRNTPQVLLDAAGVLSLAGLLYMMITVDGYSSFLYRGGQGLASLLAVFVIFSVLDGNGILSRVLSIAPLKWVGDRSYGIYLWHYPIILLISNGEKAAWWVDLIEILLTVLVAALSYALIETPIRHGAIGRSLEIIRSRPRSRRERKKRIRTLKRSIRLGVGILAIGVGVLLCIIFVPRKSALSNIEELEKQAEDASKIASQKASSSDVTAVAGEDEEQEEKDLTDEELLGRLKLLLIGDSIALGATDEFYEIFPGSISDTAVSRYTTESFAIYDGYVKGEGWDGDGVIFALGSNGLLYDSLGTLRGMIAAEKPMFIITARAPQVSWEESNNQEMYEFAETSENVYLIDWYKISEGHGEYFVEDGTHLSEEGARAYMSGIREVVLGVYRNS